jgi:drug/metabolite transporter (DMT)-like permease
VTLSMRAGLVLALASAATFGTSGTLGASLLAAGWSPGAAVTIRIALAAAVLTVPALLQLRGARVPVRRSLGPVVAFGVMAVAGAQLCYFNAVAHLSVGVALLLEYSAALLVVGWLWLRHAQRPRPLTAAGAVLAVGGMVLVLDLSGDERLDPVGVLWGLGAAVGLAVYFVLSARAEEPLPALVLAWGGLVVGSLVLLAAGAVGALQMRAPRVQVTLLDVRMSWLVPVLGLALVAAAFAYVAGIAAAQVLGARLASFVGLTEVLFAVLIAWLLLGQVPAPVQLAGGVLVLAGIALVRLDELAGEPPQTPTSVEGVGRIS